MLNRLMIRAGDRVRDRVDEMALIAPADRQQGRRWGAPGSVARGRSGD
jgi:hypothetical protein